MSENPIPGTTMFDGDQAMKGYALNRMCFSFNSAENRDAFLADEDAYCSRYGLNAEQRRWVAAPTELAVSLPARAERNRRLAETDWIMQRAWEQGSAPPPAWVAYRQALRDLPEQPGFPAEVAWPEAPSDA